MRGIDIPTPIIILCFIFGAWPIGVILAVLKAVNSDYKKQQNNRNDFINRQHGAGGFGTQGGSGGVPRATNYKSPGDVEGPNGTTYHYSYVKNKTTAAPPPFTTEPKKTGTVPPFTSSPNNGAGVPPFVSSPGKNISAQMPGVKFKTSGATVLLTIATIISLIFSVINFLGAITGLVTGINPGAIATAVISSSITAVLYLFRQFYKSRDYRVMTYISILRGERYCSLSKLADIADVSTRRVIKDLQFMISKGLLPPESVIDRGLGYLIMYKDARTEAETEAGIRRPEPEKPKTAEEIAEEMSEHEKILRRIRELNDDIDDAEVSKKIDQIEALTRKIFALVEEKPEMEAQIGSFLSYYLPTTLKLLNSYAYFEDQGVRGENIDTGMKNIEETLDMLVDGYKTQLDKLFESDTLDVATDINVLEQMMKADGFTQNSDFSVGSEFSGGTATATAPQEEGKKN